MISDDENDVHVEFSDDDIDSIEDEAFKLLESKQVTMENADGTLRCPYSPSRKKQSYPYKDLLQHAEGVAKGKRGAEAVGQHSALVKYLKTHLSRKASAPVERVHKLELAAPQRTEDQDLLVCPWSGVIYNMDNSKRGVNGQRVGPGVSEIKDHFKVFKPEKAVVCWGPKGHMGLGVLHFGRGLEGLKDAQAFEKWFIKNGYGRRDWEIRHQQNNLGGELYGWLARKEDYEGRKEIPNDWLVSKILKEAGDLTDVAMLGQEMTKMHEQRFQNLKQTVDAKEEEFGALLHEVEVARRRAEDIKLQLEAEHKKELEKVKQLAHESAREHARVMQEQNHKLQNSMKALNIKCHVLEEKAHQNEVDKTRLEQEKKENQHHLQIVNQQSELQRKHQVDQVKLIKKHEEENRKLQLWIQNTTLRLATQQQAEIESQRLGEIMDTKKFAELAGTFEPSEAVEKNVNELEEKIKAMEKKIADNQEELVSLSEQNEMWNHTTTTLMTKEKLANDELQEARKAAELAIKKYGKEDGIALKRMGEIDDGPWQRECRKRYKNAPEGWEMVFREKLSQWDSILQDSEFHPFKNVRVGEGDEWERKIDEKNPKLMALKKELGDEVLQTVMTAALELEEYNPSGRYPVPDVWNFATNKKAKLKDVIEWLVQLLVASGKKKTLVVKKRRVVQG